MIKLSLQNYYSQSTASPINEEKTIVSETSQRAIEKLRTKLELQ